MPVCLLLLCLVGCTASGPSLKESLDGLALGASLSRSKVAVGEPLEFTLRLTNTTARTVQACLGETNTYRVVGAKKEDGQFREAARETCVRPFRLGPGEVLTWKDSIPLANVGIGPARLFTSVSIVAPQACNLQYGCYHTIVASDFVSFEVVSSGSRE